MTSRNIVFVGALVAFSQFLSPILIAGGGEVNLGVPSPKVRKILTEIHNIEAKVLSQKPSENQVEALMSSRACLLEVVYDLATTSEEKDTLMKQHVDFLSVAALIGIYPGGVHELQEIEAGISRVTPGSTLLPFTIYRRMQAEYSMNMAAAGNNNRVLQAAVQRNQLQSLNEFVTRFPTAEDTDDALMCLGNQEELQGNAKKAIEWYQKLIQEIPNSKLVTRAQGCVKRLNLNGQVLTLDGPLLTDGRFNCADMKDKVYVVVFWNSTYSASEENIRQLRELYREYKKDGFEIIGVALETEKEIALEFVKKNEMIWPQIFQAGSHNQFGEVDSPIALQYGIISIPTMFLINKDGKVVSRDASIQKIKSELRGLSNSEWN